MSDRQQEPSSANQKEEVLARRSSGHQYGTVDLVNCDREPIHVPGAIQPHGFLLGVFPAEMEIALASANVGELLGQPGPFVGKSLDTILDATCIQRMQKTFLSLGPKHVESMHTKISGKPWECLFHSSGDLLIVECEPSERDEPETALDFYRRSQDALTRLQRGVRVEEICRIAAREVRELTGFDRVMVYRFHSDHSGEVIAEAKHANLDSYLGLRYPAADIPSQARRLYELSTLRLIARVDYEPSPVEPTENPLTGEPLDMSHAVLRSVSPIHREYLRNMGVGASMSISLLDERRKLWGLIACHHNDAKFLSHEIRRTCDFLGQALAWQVSAREREAVAQRIAESSNLRADLLKQVSTADELTEALTREPDGLLAIVNSSAAIVVQGDRAQFIGCDETAAELLDGIRCAIDESGTFFSDDLHASLGAEPETLPWSGAGAIALDSAHRDLVVWLRPEYRHQVRWGHENAKHSSTRPKRLSPPGSFATWEETVRGRAEPWEPWQMEAARLFRGALIESLARRAEYLEKLNAELREASEMKDVFLATVSHELRNPMNAIVGWVHLLQSDRLPEERRRYGLKTLERNASVQQQLIDDLLDVSRIISGKMSLKLKPCDLGDIVDAAIETVSSAASAKSITVSSRIDSSAADINGDPDRLQQIVWNLLANAVKFTPKGGQVRVSVERQESSSLIIVADNGEGIEPDLLDTIFDRFHQGQRKPGSRGGLGLGLSLVSGLTELHGGTVRAFSEGPGTGSQFEVVLPRASIRLPADHPDRPSFEPELGEGPTLEGLSVLCVDDDVDSTELMAEILGAAGAEVETANNGADALAILERVRVDVLISDIGMPDMDGYELIQRIRRGAVEGAERVPAAALTAYGQSRDRTRAFAAGFQTHLAKPVDGIELRTIIASLVGRTTF